MPLYLIQKQQMAVAIVATAAAAAGLMHIPASCLQACMACVLTEWPFTAFLVSHSVPSLSTVTLLQGVILLSAPLSFCTKKEASVT
jgi:hypothetical protein